MEIMGKNTKNTSDTKKKNKPERQDNKWNNGNQSKNIEQNWNVDKQMQISWVHTMCGCIVCQTVVSQEIQRCHYKIIDAQIQIVNFGQSQKAIIQRIHEHEHHKNWNTAANQNGKPYVEIGSKWYWFRTKATAHPEKNDGWREKQKCWSIEEANNANGRYDGTFVGDVRWNKFAQFS